VTGRLAVEHTSIVQHNFVLVSEGLFWKSVFDFGTSYSLNTQKKKTKKKPVSVTGNEGP
jgi:hypothetical protein